MKMTICVICYTFMWSNIEVFVLGTISCIEKWMEKALGLARRRYKGFTPQELTEGLNRLAVNDTNKMKVSFSSIL